MYKSRDTKLVIRDGILEDKSYLVSWLKEPGILNWFPMCNDIEIEDAAKYWVSFAEKKALLTAEYEGKPCGIINIYLKEPGKLAHQALFAIIVDPCLRGRGIGTLLLRAMKKRAKEVFQIELLHLEVYDGNPAIRLYEREGFRKYGFQKDFIKESSSYIGKYLMQTRL